MWSWFSCSNNNCSIWHFCRNLIAWWIFEKGIPVICVHQCHWFVYWIRFTVKYWTVAWTYVLFLFVFSFIMPNSNHFDLYHLTLIVLCVIRQPIWGYLWCQGISYDTDVFLNGFWQMHYLGCVYRVSPSNMMGMEGKFPRVVCEKFWLYVRKDDLYPTLVLRHAGIWGW